MSGRPRLWMHVGLPKCGSSSLQAVLYGGVDRLKAMGVLYPQTGSPDDGEAGEGAEDEDEDEDSEDGRPLLRPRHYVHNLIAADLIRTPDPGEPATSPILNRVLDQFGPEHATMIVSGEALILHPSQFRAERLDPRIHQFATELIVFTRRRDDWLLSAYKQHVKAVDRISLSFDAYLEGHVFTKVAIPRSIEHLQAFFRADRVHVRAVDQGVGSIQAFAETTGLPIADWKAPDDVRRTSFTRPSQLNISPSDPATLFLLELNRRGVARPAQRRALFSTGKLDLDAVLGERLRLMRPEVSARLLLEDRPVQARLRDAYGADLSEPEPRSPDPDARYVQALEPTQITRVLDAIEPLMKRRPFRQLRQALRR